MTISKIAVVIPSFKVRDHIIEVINSIGEEVEFIYVVDDCCPEHSGSYVENNCKDSRIKVIRHAENLGVGGAVMSGYKAALKDKADIIVKIDGDGQMDPVLIPMFLEPILQGRADYTKGNRFFNLESIRSMPRIRLFGNAVLSFMTKLSSGYWDLFDPTNGYTAVHANVVQHLPFSKISKRYFFETDMLFRLNTLGAVVVDIPMEAKYGAEISNLKITKVFTEFLRKHIRNFSKRVFYNYYLRDMSLASIELPCGLLLFIFGAVFGGWHWMVSSINERSTATGTIMLSALFLLMGLQLILAFLSYDISSVPRQTKHQLLQKHD